ncbi:hypothetical protein NG831_21590 [Xanthomonas sacchari]|uniref:hypothetical protein n=1 Tax=Xanthomonas sacchari TaxID=56458 RepID=UPI002250A450|nr:hypothetical protein [Xanthomonas sacchari]UYK66648.1 hypothetical protein NG831_21590 [Xanthomonas sacchari]
MSLDPGSRGDVALMRIKAITMLPSMHRKLAAMYCLLAWVMVSLQMHATAIAFLSVALLHLVSARRLASAPDTAAPAPESASTAPAGSASPTAAAPPTPAR